MTSTGPLIRCRESVLAEIRQHVSGDVSVEHGGVLVGRFTAGRVDVLGAVPAHSATSDATSLTFTSEAWAEIETVRTQRHGDLPIVGWYHSHPRFGIFLSNHDRYIHENFFNERHHVAYVVDPVGDSDGFFAWDAGELVRSERWQVVGADGVARDMSINADVPTDVPLRSERREELVAYGEPTRGSDRKSAADGLSTPFLAALVAFLVGGVVGWIANGGSGESTEIAETASQAAAIAESTTDVLTELTDDTGEEGRAVLPTAMLAAEHVLDYLDAVAERDLSEREAEFVDRARAELERALEVARATVESERLQGEAREP